MNGLALTWVAIIAFGIIMYVILDGFDLGIGILTIFFRKEYHRDLMISVILPVWDGNETWLVFGGAALYGAFPIAFSMLLPALYIPIILMVIALIFRGVSFEFRLKAKRSKRFWEWCFSLGSLFATLAQGVILGAFVEGFTLTPQSQTLSLYHWLNPFSIICAIALVQGYALLGSNRLIDKTVGGLQEQCFRISKRLQYLILFFSVIVSAWSPYLDPRIKARWFNPHYMPYLAILPLATLIIFVLHVHAIKRRFERLPFWSAVGIFLLCYLGFIISSYPYLVPRHITYLQAASGEGSLLFMLIGACIMMPPLLYYTYYSYKIFKGKVIEPIEY